MLFIYPHSRARPQTNYHYATRECAHCLFHSTQPEFFICPAQRVAFMLNLARLFVRARVPLFTLFAHSQGGDEPHNKVEFRKTPPLYSEKGSYARRADKLHLGLLSIWTGRTLSKIISLRAQCHGQFLCSIDWTRLSDLIW
jgi:hypothetical protein